MRDVKAGRDINVQGDVHITDNAYQPKLLVQCTNQELFAERSHRYALLRDERKAKWKRLTTAWLVTAVVLGVVSLWFYIQDKHDLASLILGLGGLAAAAASVKVLDRPSEFEARQLAALHEISMILRERAAER